MKKVAGTVSICFYVQNCARLTLSIPGGGGVESAPLGTFLNNSKKPKDNEMKFSHFDFKAWRVILHTLTILIVLICCHGNLLLPVCQVIFGGGK